MAIIKIVFDTKEESLMDVIERLDGSIITAEELEWTRDNIPPPSAADSDPKVVEELKDIVTNTPPDIPPPPADDSGPTAEELAKAKEEMGESSSPSLLLDTDGVTWDERIHSGNKKTAAKTGKWMKRRGVSDDLYATVTAELKAAADVPAPPPPADDTPGPPPPTPGQWDWNILVKTLTKARAEGKTTKEQEADVLSKMGITLFPLLSSRTELYDQFCNELGLVHP